MRSVSRTLGPHCAEPSMVYASARDTNFVPEGRLASRHVLSGAWELRHLCVPRCEARADCHDKTQGRAECYHSDIIQVTWQPSASVTASVTPFCFCARQNCLKMSHR